MEYDLRTLQSENLQESFNGMIENGYDMYYSKKWADLKKQNKVNEYDSSVHGYVINKKQVLGTKKIHSEKSLQDYLEIFPDAIFVFKMEQCSTQKHIGEQCKGAISNGNRCDKIVPPIKGRFCPECLKSNGRDNGYFFM